MKQQMELHLRDKSQPSGVRMQINGRGVALFYWKEELYCMDEKCPHLGSYYRDIRTNVLEPITGICID